MLQQEGRQIKTPPFGVLETNNSICRCSKKKIIFVYFGNNVEGDSGMTPKHKTDGTRKK